MCQRALTYVDKNEEVFHLAPETILPPRINSLTYELSTVATNTFNNMTRARPVGNIVKTSIKAALDLTLRHLVFSDHPEGPFSYLELYSTGIHYGSLARWEGLPARGEVEIRSQTDLKDKKYRVAECLHPIIKEALHLDAGLLLTICARADVTNVYDGESRNSDPDVPRDKLKTWYGKVSSNVWSYTENNHHY